ncbi:MAG: hypothetical protein EVJ46_00125 [Candidatus Acididesulfobacter guangdongensis]|uniref:Uncharacterized protein n=1 Tax=Acididesulfobacter guangdongensis TaxID=2597225 RepID=A0A519BHD4_ACIG2|nr:MAG: hypothetical protein EVJ46_00125 [Candidatus Acididesulfobacter guangdongensis]
MTYLSALHQELENSQDTEYLKMKKEQSFCRQVLKDLYNNGSLDLESYETLSKSIVRIKYFKDILKYCKKYDKIQNRKLM